jgi:hypothetical protein
VSAYGSGYIGRYAVTYKDPHDDGVRMVDLRLPSSPRTTSLLRLRSVTALRRDRASRGRSVHRTADAAAAASRPGASAIAAPRGPTSGGWAAFTSQATKWPDIGWRTQLPITDGSKINFMVFYDAPECIEHDVIENGAGPHIMRLPESPNVPPMPDLESLPSAAPAPTPAFLPTDWRTTEELACAHLRSLGSADARLTTGGRDGGVDAVAQDAVAQVKMQALPVGAPQVQQLRGTQPHLHHHIFYSSSGYTAAALTAAAETGVHLFKIEPNGSVQPANAPAVALTRAGVHTDQPRTVSVEQVVEEYASGVRDRTGSRRRSRPPTSPEPATARSIGARTSGC